jgi:hypothetical protein
MIRRVFAVGGVLMLLSSCGPTHYRNYLHPSYGQTQFDRDWYECRRENTHPSTVVAGAYGSAEMVVDENMALACLAARGWRPVTNPN